MWCPQCQMKTPLIAVGPVDILCATCQSPVEGSDKTVGTPSSNPARQTETSILLSAERPISQQVDAPSGSVRRIRFDAAHGSPLSNAPKRFPGDVSPPHFPLVENARAALEPIEGNFGSTAEDRGAMTRVRHWQLWAPTLAIVLFVSGQLLHLAAYNQHHRHSLILGTVISVVALGIALLYGRRTPDSSLLEHTPDRLPSAPVSKLPASLRDQSPPRAETSAVHQEPITNLAISSPSLNQTPVLR